MVARTRNILRQYTPGKHNVQTCQPWYLFVDNLTHFAGLALLLQDNTGNAPRLNNHFNDQVRPEWPNDQNYT